MVYAYDTTPLKIISVNHFSIESVQGIVSKNSYYIKYNNIFEEEKQIHKQKNDWNDMFNGEIMYTFFVRLHYFWFVRPKN